MKPEELDDLINKAVEIVCQYDRASAALLQRRLSIGYARAARLMDQLEALKVIGTSNGTSIPREVLIKDAKEFNKGIPLKEVKLENTIPFPINNYIPKKAKFLPKEYLEVKDVKEIILGTDGKGKIVKANFDEIGNLIVIGSPISKKCEFIESFLLTTLSTFSTKDINLIIYDSTFSFSSYKIVPHYLTPIISNWEKSISALRWAISEANRRFKLRVEGSGEKFSEIYFIYNFDFTDIERESCLKILTSAAYKAGMHVIILTDQINDIPKSVRENIPVRLTFDKFGEYKANYEFKEITPITTIPVKSSEVDKYLKSI